MNKIKGEQIYAILFYSIIAFLVIYFLFFRHNQINSPSSLENITPIPTEDIFVPTNIPTPIIYQQPVYQNSPVTQSYWYCWDTGNPSPHHLGHPVYGDHLCTNQELGR